MSFVFVNSRASVLGIIIIFTYKNDPGSKIDLGVCDHFETKLLQCIMKQKENIHIVIGWR